MTVSKENEKLVGEKIKFNKKIQKKANKKEATKSKKSKFKYENTLSEVIVFFAILNVTCGM